MINYVNKMKKIIKSVIKFILQKGFMTKSNVHLVEKINNYLRQNNFDNIFYKMHK